MWIAHPYQLSSALIIKGSDLIYIYSNFVSDTYCKVSGLVP